MSEGIKINDPSLTDLDPAQATDKLAAARGAQGGNLTPSGIADFMSTQGFLQGNPNAVYVEDQTTNWKWQLGQKGIALPTTTSPNEATPDLQQNDVFQIQPSGTEFELQLPDNPPTISDLGIGAAATMYFVIYARNASDGSAGGLTFGSDYVELPGSKPYLKSGTNRTNIIHCWYSVTGVVYYRVENVSYTIGQPVPLDVTIPSADILNGNTVTIDILTGTAANNAIVQLAFEIYPVNGSTVYTANTNLQFFRGGTESNFIQDFNLGSLVPGRFNGDSPGHSSFANLLAFEGDSLRAKVETGDPASGDYDLRIIGTYRVIQA